MAKYNIREKKEKDVTYLNLVNPELMDTLMNRIIDFIGNKKKYKEKGYTAKKPKKGIVKYFKDCKAEFKKVVWPTPKETTHNTIVVIVVCLLAGLFVFGIDSLFALINSLILRG